jgi:hypothetical protein
MEVGILHNYLTLCSLYVYPRVRLSCPPPRATPLWRLCQARVSSDQQSRQAFGYFGRIEKVFFLSMTAGAGASES